MPDTNRSKFTAELEAEILNGKMTFGDRLPSVRILSERYGVPPSSIKSGLVYLEGKGYLEKRPKKAGYVVVYRAAPVLKPHHERTALLIVDDVEINRAVLGVCFTGEYDILEASNGVEALELLHKHKHSIAAVLLDIIMPVMDGIEVLRRMQNDNYYRNIPVIIISGGDEFEYSLGALQNGAVDYLSKPADPEIVRLRVSNAVARRKADDIRSENRYLLYRTDQMKYDELTGIYNKMAFLESARRVLDDNPDTEFVIVRFDVRNFSVINDIFGHKEGDRLLRYIADGLRKMEAETTVFARFDADNFMIFMPYDRELMDRRLKIVHDMAHGYDIDFDIRLNFGVYIIDNRELSVEAMADRAIIAQRSIKNSFLDEVAYYDEELRANVLEEQWISNHMLSALENGEFVIYMQPKVRISDGDIIGAEALVRWRQPDRGMLPPSAFIPIFEKNGFIMKLDAYIWERVCVWLRRRITEGLPVVPVSVNISRINIYNPNLIQIFNGLVEKYGIPKRCIELEITESAYADNSKLLLDIMNELNANGFTLEMDDFGSGYSSLNMLKDAPVDVLKLDMRFLSDFSRKTPDGSKGTNILEAVVNMSRVLGIPVIAEGVETEEQSDFLISVGCDMAQGFLYGRPQPLEEFEKLLAERVGTTATASNGGVNNNTEAEDGSRDV